MTVEEQAQALKDTLATKASTEQVANIEKQIEGLDTLKTSIDGLTEFMNQHKEKAEGEVKIQSLETQVHKFIEDNHDAIKTLRSQGHGLIELEVKAVGVMTTQSASMVATFPQEFGAQIAPAGNVALRGTIVESLVSRVKTSLATYPYTETLPKDGDYGFVAEGAIKPQLDFKIETNYAKPVKVAGWIKLTEESVQDIPGLQSIATDLLRKKHDLKKQKGILFGDGTSPNPKGATLFGRAFVAGAMATKVLNPNIMDVINAGITDVYTTHNYEDETNYEANIVLINPIDFFINFVSAKTNEGIPLYPTASLFNRVIIGGVTIIPMEDIPAGKIFISDLSKYNITDWMGYTVKIGWVNDDFIKNQFVILGESRFHAFVKRLDEQAFIYDDIDAIKTAIEKPSTKAGK